MSDPQELFKAFNNMKLYTQDHLIYSLRPELRRGVLEAIEIFQNEILRLKTERAELERKLGITVRASSSFFGQTSLKNLEEERGSKASVVSMDTKTREASAQKSELRRPSGPIDIGRPYPVYVICYVCDKRVLTKTAEKSTGGCCISCLTEEPPMTVIHTCPICKTFLGIYYDRVDD